ncbi:MAG: VOC family protein [Planctomycetota bacterium]
MAEASAQAPPATNTFCWNELMTRDPSTARSFYTSLFGWTAEDMDMGERGTYTIWRMGDKQTGGMMALKGPGMDEVPSHWLAYIAVDDVDASTRRAEGLGAKVCVPPTDIPNIGRYSVITDPTGGSLGLFKGT